MEKRNYIWNKCTIEVHWQLKIESRDISVIFSHLSPSKKARTILIRFFCKFKVEIEWYELYYPYSENIATAQKQSSEMNSK